MKLKIWRHLAIAILLIMSVLIHFFGQNEHRVEAIFSKGIYSGIGEGLRLLTGWVPFSIGDLFYGAAIFWLMFKIVQLIRLIKKSGLKAIKFRVNQWEKLVLVILVIYVWFNGAWGLNYNRNSAAQVFGLDTTKYTESELIELNKMLAEKVNFWKDSAIKSSLTLPTKSAMFKDAAAAYGEAKKDFPFLTYQNPSVKPSIWSYAGNYLGFTGYYNPFSGEAQVNTTVPKFVQPFTTCHEIGHQLGFAKEDEANFVGYIAASRSANPHFRYSVYFDLFIYANRNLRMADSIASRNIYGTISQDVKRDIIEWRKFLIAHRNPMERLVMLGYDFYLTQNKQPGGIFTYDEVNALLIGYWKKYGTI